MYYLPLFYLPLRTALCLLIVGLLLAFCSRTPDKKKAERDYMENFQSVHADGYVGGKACISCHSEAYADWKGSDHDLAMQVAGDATVLGDFDNVETTLDGVHYVFYRLGKAYRVKITEIDGSVNDYEIGYTFGYYPLQQYLVDFDRGRKQVLRVSWDVDGRRWYHQYAGDRLSPHDWLHWTESAQNWNGMCAECHSTNLKRNYFQDADSFYTTWSSINVDCESCHGPGEKHVFQMQQGGDGDTSAWKSYMRSAHTQFQQMNTCAPCHSRRIKLTENMTPGDIFSDQFMLQDLSTAYYHPDGQIENEDYVYGSFLQSKMYHNDVKCSDCHNVHSTKLKLEGNKLCLQCHEPKYDAPGHHFHRENTVSAECVSCHMPGETYMGIDFRRDHSFRIPRPDQSVEYGTPNACTQCHTDKSDTWAAEHIVKWYGPNREDHFSDALLLSNRASVNMDEQRRLLAFINDLKYPAIARATVLDNIYPARIEDYKPIIDALKDAFPLMRYNALQKFLDAPAADRLAVAAEHLGDTSRLVRIGAAQLLNGISERDRAGLRAADVDRARSEYLEMLQTGADQPAGRMQLGDYYMQNNQIDAAIRQYGVALRKDSLLLPVYPNLAIAYSTINQPEKALKTLNIFLAKEPDYARGYYLRGLLLLELNRAGEGLTDLKKAARLDPNDTRSLYNLATWYYQQGNAKEARHYIDEALKKDPANGDYKYLLALIYQQMGMHDESMKILQDLQARRAAS